MGLTFDSPTHVYELDGVRVPSVTGILRSAGLVDFSQIPTAVLRAARDRGTKVHQAIHFFNEQDLDVNWFCTEFPGYAGYLQSWVRLMESGRLQTMLCEHRVASRRYQFAGTIDWLGCFDGDAALIDFATGDPEDCAKDLQTAAYVVAAKEWAEAEESELALRQFLSAYPFVKRYSIRLKKDGSLPTPEFYRDGRHGQQFLALVFAQQIVRARKPKVYDWTEYAA